ncbi:hypothetical protein KFK09_008809 [Dendrobium nobile]|uniref:CCHC-type domain-containing protein n=1 Tax=Dendrobium nobile TaxID=94219 RepID=A0A8T3BM71_DENNO|nr:hypothetical protein KFK09_008809 [Dendrobium nobile]
MDNLINDNSNALNEAKNNLAALQEQEETYWKQKAASKLIVEGDRNTKFFHTLANKKRVQNHIFKIMGEGGVFFEKEEDIFASGVDYFEHIFNKDTATTPIANPFIIPKCITDMDNQMLIKPPSEEEVWNIIKDMNIDSTADPDNCNIRHNGILNMLDSWARNEAKHEGIRMDAMRIIDNIKCKILQLFNAKMISGKIFKNCSFSAQIFGIPMVSADFITKEKIVKWVKPGIPFVKLNSDGSVGSNTAGMGDIIRNYMDYRMWMLIKEGYSPPSREINGVKTEITFTEWTFDERDLAQLNAKYLNYFFCALKSEDYMRVSTYKTGTNEVKQSRLNILLHNYELFRMKPHESISDMYTRFTQIVTSLHALERELSNFEKVNKILRCLPSSYDAKISVIPESKDSNTYSIDNLLGSLIAYEQGVNQRNLDAGEKKKEKTVALKAHKSDSKSSGSESDEVAFITRQFKSFVRKKQKHHWRKGKDYKHSKGSSDVVCYECRKPGHVKANCPILQDHSSKEKEKGEEKPKFKKDKKRVQKAFWAESGTDSSETEPEEETTKLCLMGEDHLEQSDEEKIFCLVGDALTDLLRFVLIDQDDVHIVLDDIGNACADYLAKKGTLINDVEEFSSLNLPQQLRGCFHLEEFFGEKDCAVLFYL